MTAPPNKKADSPGRDAPAPPAQKPAFERSLARLEEVVRKLESANLALDEAMKLFEEGVQLSRDCQKQLEEAEGRVEILMKRASATGAGPGGSRLVAEPFDSEEESS